MAGREREIADASTRLEMRAKNSIFLSLSSCFISYLSVPPFLFRVFLIIKIYDFKHLTREELVYLEISLQFIPRDRISRDVSKNFHRSPPGIILYIYPCCIYVITLHIYLYTRAEQSNIDTARVQGSGKFLRGQPE